MILALTAVSAIVPSILLAWFIYSRDYRREPKRTVWATFGLGVLAIVPAVLVGWPIDALLTARIAEPLARGPASALLVAAIPEELFKFAVLYFYARRRRCFDEPMDGIVYGAIASLGFATLENIMYCLQGSLSTALFRAFTSVPGHAFWGAIMGYYVGIAHFSPRSERAKWLLRALAWPILLHAAYDAPLLALKDYGEHKLKAEGGAAAMVAALMLGSLGVIVITWVQGIRLTLRMRRAQRLTLPAAPPLPGVSGPAVSPKLAALAALWPRTSNEGHEPPPSAPAQGSRAVAALLLIFGSLLTVGGALGELLLVIGLTLQPAGRPGAAIVAVVLFGVLPLAVGVVLFALGLRRLPNASPRWPPQPA